MSEDGGRPLIIDAGPTLTFTAAGKRDLLLDVVTGRGLRLLTPESVIEEVERKSAQRRFERCHPIALDMIGRGQLEVLSDSIDDVELAREVLTITGVGTAVRLGQSKDLGETMVMAHALKLRGAGATVRVFIDEWRGQSIAQGYGLNVVSTEAILAGAIEQRIITDRGEMRAVYGRLRDFDDGLVHIDQTRLLDRSRYRQAREA